MSGNDHAAVGSNHAPASAGEIVAAWHASMRATASTMLKSRRRVGQAKRATFLHCCRIIAQSVAIRLRSDQGIEATAVARHLDYLALLSALASHLDTPLLIRVVNEKRVLVFVMSIDPEHRLSAWVEPRLLRASP
jgi:hypothetical protein